MPAKPLLLGLYAAFFLLLAPPSTWLLLRAPTWVGRAVALAGFLLLVLPLLLLRSWQRPAHHRLWLAGLGLSLLLAAVLFAALLLAAPSGNAGPHSPVQHRFFREHSFSRYGLTNLIPEIEQVNLGFSLMPYLDPIMTRAQGAAVAPPTLALYRQMEQDPNFRELGSVMGLAYAGLAGLPFDAGHYYLYRPRNAPPGPLPALVFLHGSAGNFKLYTWIWSQLADNLGIVIISPSYGFGTWDEQGLATVLEALENAGQVVPLDRQQIYLAGLSNGGVAVAQLAAAHPDRFRGLIFLSPVMPPAIIQSDRFQQQWAGRPVLILSGQADRRIPASYVQQQAAALAAAGVHVTTILYPQADHFLIFTHPQPLLEDVAAWLSRHPP